MSGAAEIVAAVSQVLADINLPVRVRDLVDDLHRPPLGHGLRQVY